MQVTPQCCNRTLIQFLIRAFASKLTKIEKIYDLRLSKAESAKVRIQEM